MSSVFIPLLTILFLAVLGSGSHLNRVPRLSILADCTFLAQDHAGSLSMESDDTQSFFFDQTLDHFNYRPDSYATFKHKYIINSKYWGGADSSAPILAYLGGEEPIVDDVLAIGFLTDNAPRFKALILYIEHRFYGDSIPFGLSLEEIINNSDTRGYFNSAQALADYAEVIIHVKKTLNAHKSPVIVVGGSYGGMLASWFRLKYPHIAAGAFASSAPILLPVNFTLHYGYYTIVSKSFRKTSESCYQTIKRSWEEIDRVASKPRGLQYLSKTFKTCKTLRNSTELKDYLITTYSTAAQYDDPFSTPVSKLCRAINSNRSSSILYKIFAGLAATTTSSTNSSCYINPPQNLTQTYIGWPWQACSDIIIPAGRGNMTMFQASSRHELSDYIDGCKRKYGVAPRPHWVSTYYGGQDIKLILQRFGSNIIFSNGLKDPFSNGGVLANISDTIAAVYTKEGSHCLDLLAATTEDPEWLIKQRVTEVGIIEKWLQKYYEDHKITQDI